MSTGQTAGSISMAAQANDYLTEYQQKTPTSAKLFKRAQLVTEGGMSHNPRYSAPYPLYVDKAQGSKVWDVDGNRFVDLWMGHSDSILGHSPPEVVAQLKELMGDGFHIGIPMEHEITLGEKIQKMMPCAERVRFCCSGTEATMFAVRLARGFTGRNTILKIMGGWHGANTDLLVDVFAPEFIGAEGKGLPPDLTKYTKAVRFNDIEDTARVIREAGDDFAGIILSPLSAHHIPADLEYLEFLQEETKKSGALLIFDEVVTGFRLAPGGAQEFFGITPDLATIGKVMGGGMPIGGVVGRADVFADSAATNTGGKADKIIIGGGTYSCNPLSMVAGKITLDILDSHKDTLYPGINSASKRIAEGAKEAFAANGIPVNVTNTGSVHEVHFLKEEGLPIRNINEFLENGLAARSKELSIRLCNHGVYNTHGGNLSSEHSDEDVDYVIAAYRKIAGEMAETQA